MNSSKIDRAGACWGACRFPELPDELWPWWRGCRPTVVIVILIYAGSPFRRYDTRTVLGSFLPPRWCEEAHGTEYWTHCMHSRTLHPDGTLWAWL